MQPIILSTIKRDISDLEKDWLLGQVEEKILAKAYCI